MIEINSILELTGQWGDDIHHFLRDALNWLEANHIEKCILTWNGWSHLYVRREKQKDTRESVYLKYKRWRKYEAIAARKVARDRINDMLHKVEA